MQPVAYISCTSVFPLVSYPAVSLRSSFAFFYLFVLFNQTSGQSQIISTLQLVIFSIQGFSVIFYYLSMDTVKGGECNSSWQTLIFLLSFPPAPWFVDLAPISDAVLAWMDFWLRCKGIISLRVQSAGEQVTVAQYLILFS